MVKGMVHNPNQYTDLLMIHWRIHTQSGWNAMKRWNDTCYIVAWLWYNIIPHLINLTPLTVPSKKYGPMIQLAVTPAHHHVWWVVLHLKHVTRILFCPKKHCDPGCWLIAVVTCALPHRVVKSCKVMPSHKMQIYWNKSINKSGVWLLRYLVHV